jgi:ethanolaminephosphotransferase
MSGTASNYNLSRLYAGIGITWLATMAALFVSGEVIQDARSTGLWMAPIAISYGVMMFASSYVEEEQQFWYWATSSWLGWLLVKALVHDLVLQVDFQTDGRALRGTKQRIIPSISAIIVLAIVRMVRGWNQTGQKHAGEPDIARTILPLHNRVLWFLVLGTYFNITQRLARKVLPGISRHISAASSIALCVATLGLKIVFTKAEAPELLVGLQTDFLRPMEEISLVVQARVVFIGIGTLVSLTMLAKAFEASAEENGEGIAHTVGRPQDTKIFA